MGILHRRRRPHGITKATTEIQEQENLIKRDFKAEKPLKKLLSDITEIQCYDGKLYVSAVLDCFNGEILSIAMDSNMKKELCIRTVKELMMQYGKKLKGAIFHSDRGSQYTSEAFRDALKDAGLQQSLSGTGHCFDNARMESFFATLKERKDIQNCGIQADTGAGEKYHLPVHLYLLQSDSHILCQSGWACSCRISRVGKIHHAGRLTAPRAAAEFSPFRYAPLRKFSCNYRFFSDLGDFSTAHILTIP